MFSQYPSFLATCTDLSEPEIVLWPIAKISWFITDFSLYTMSSHQYDKTEGSSSFCGIMKPISYGFTDRRLSKSAFYWQVISFIAHDSFCREGGLCVIMSLLSVPPCIFSKLLIVPDNHKTQESNVPSRRI